MFLKVVGAEQEKVSREKAVVSEEERKVQLINEDVARKQKSCQDDLVKAEPALNAARDALATLNRVSKLIPVKDLDL